MAAAKIKNTAPVEPYLPWADDREDRSFRWMLLIMLNQQQLMHLHYYYYYWYW